MITSLINDVLSDYPDFFTSVSQFGTDKVELSFAGYKKDEINAHFKGNKLVVVGENEDRGKLIRTVLIDRRLSPEDVKLKYKAGLITVSAEKPKEQKSEIKIE